MHATNFHQVREHWESVSKMQKNIIIAPVFQVSTKRDIVYDRIHRGTCNLTMKSGYISHSVKHSENNVQDLQPVESSSFSTNESVQSSSKLDHNPFEEISTEGKSKGALPEKISLDEHKVFSSDCGYEDENKENLFANGSQDAIQIGNLTICVPKQLEHFDFSDDENSITVGSTESASTDGHSIQTAIFSDDGKDVEDSSVGGISSSKITNDTNNVNERIPSLMAPHPKINTLYDSPLMVNISSGRSREDASPLPDRTLIKKTGLILSRLSVRSMLMKKWHQTFWVHYDVSTFLIFRKKDDFEQWLCNPHFTKRERDKLVKLRFKFCDRIGKRGGNSKDSRMSPLKLKYSGTNTPLYCFKLERLTDFSVNKTIAFASESLHSSLTLRRCLQSCFDKLADQKVRSVDDVLIRPTRNQSSEDMIILKT